MARILAVISKAVFEKTAAGLELGDVHAVQGYDSNPKPFEALAAGGRLYVVTARPGDRLWLVAIIDQPKLARGKWVGRPNATPITDLTSLVAKLRFASGNGIHAKPGQLGMSLQTPRALADADVALIDRAVAAASRGKPVSVPLAPIPPSLERGMIEGRDRAFLAYAETLGDDPRAELVRIQRRLAAKPNDRKLKAAEEALFKAHGPVLLGALAKRKKKLGWRLGFIEHATVNTGGPAGVAELVDNASARFVRELEVETDYDVMPAAILRLAKKPLPALRSLTLRQRYKGWDKEYDSQAPEPTDPTYAIEWGCVGRHGPKPGDTLWRAAPSLTSLHLDGWMLFHTLPLKALEQLTLDGRPCCERPSWNLPKLTTLSWKLGCDDTDTGVDWEIDALSPLWTSKLPALRSLDLSECGSVGCLDYAASGGEDDLEDYVGWALRRKAGFRKLAAQLDELVLYGDHLKTKKQIARWIEDR